MDMSTCIQLPWFAGTCIYVEVVCIHIFLQELCVAPALPILSMRDLGDMHPSSQVWNCTWCGKATLDNPSPRTVVVVWSRVWPISLDQQYCGVGAYLTFCIFVTFIHLFHILQLPVQMGTYLHMCDSPFYAKLYILVTLSSLWCSVCAYSCWAFVWQLVGSQTLHVEIVIAW